MSAATQPLPSLVRILRRWFAANDRYSPTPFADLERAYEISTSAVRYFYFASAFYVWILIKRLHQMVIGNPPLELAWPIMWAEGLPILAVVDVLSVSCACFAGLAFWKPSIIAWRIAFAMTFLMCAAVPVSLGAVNHGYHEWFWVAFVFIFLPSGATKNASRPVKMSYLMTFSTIQCLILMFYTMAGTWKVLAGIKSLVAGVPGNFSPHSLSWTLANRMAQTNTEPLLGPFMVDNPLLGLPAFWFLMYAQVASVFVAFRPSLHRAWAIALIAFHTGTFLLMEIPFPTHIAILALLFLVSPFQREDWLRFETLYNLPIFGDIARAVRSHSASKPVAQPQPETA